MKYFLMSMFCSLAFSVQAHAQGNIPRFVRTVIYDAVQKDTTWTTGAVVDRIRFVKFNTKGLRVIENILNPDASVHSKIVFFYDNADRVAEEARYSGKNNKWIVFAYEYDEKGRIIRSAEKDLKGKERYITTVTYNDENRIVQRVAENIDERFSITYDINYSKDNGPSKVTITNSKGTQYTNDLQKSDTTSLKSYHIVPGGEYLADPFTKNANATFEYDEYNNWVKIVEHKKDIPDVIILRDIEYYGERTDLDDLLLRGKVKSMEQIAYVPIPTNSEIVYKGDKLGDSYRYIFNESGKKTARERYSAKGALVGKTEWEYDGERIVKELHRGANNKIQSYNQWIYNRDGNVKNKIMYDAQDSLIRTGAFRYDLEYNCIQEIWQDPNAEIYSDIRYEYNSYGQQIGVRPIAHLEGGESLYSVKRNWNFKGRLLDEQVNKLPGVGRELFTYKYNSKGEVIAGTEQMDTQAAVNYKYKFSNDEQGNWVIRVKYINEVPVAYEERKYVYYK